MAECTVRDIEGMRQVEVGIAGESIRARRGALSNMRGQIKMTPLVPGVRDMLRAMFTGDAAVRPIYEGSGTIQLQPSLEGYHILQVRPGERWIFEPGVYWASEGALDLGVMRERFWPSLWAGDGLLAFKTTVAGEGKVVVNAAGPVETVDVRDGELRVQGRLVLGRTHGLRFHSERSAPIPRNFISGQKRMRVFRGTGKALVCWTPYWNQHMYEQMTGEVIRGSLLE